MAGPLRTPTSLKPILLALGIAVAAMAAGLHHRNAARHAAGELARLQSDQATADAALAGFRARSDATAKRLEQVSRELAEAMAELRGASEAAFRARIEPDPTTEGAWPPDRPYFYLPKRLLADIGFTALTANGEPTAECLALLGMTPAEQADLRQAWVDLHFELQEIQLQLAERVPDAESQADPDQRSIRFRLPSLSRQLQGLDGQLGSRLTEAVGATRARILDAPLREQIGDLTNPMGDRDCFVAYRAERTSGGDVQHYLRFDAINGSTTYQVPVGTLRANPGMIDEGVLTFPIGPDSALWNYRHLFGDQPLLRPY